MDSPSHVSVIIFDAFGRVIKTLVDEKKNKGYYQVTWDGINNEGLKTPSGVYFCIVEVVDEMGNVQNRTMKILQINSKLY